MPKAYIFRRKIGPPMPSGGSAGHIGWAFSLDNDAILCGSTENLNSMPWHPAGGDNGWWAKTVPDEKSLLQEMRRHHYDDYKAHDVSRVHPQKSRTVAENCRAIGYSFTGNNCVDHAYQIICHYGALDLPLPLDFGYPNGWFSAIAWQHHLLT